MTNNKERVLSIVDSDPAFRAVVTQLLEKYQKTSPSHFDSEWEKFINSLKPSSSSSTEGGEMTFTTM